MFVSLATRARPDGSKDNDHVVFGGPLNVQISDEELGFLRSIRIVIGETVNDNCQRMASNGYLNVSDIVRQISSLYNFNMNNEKNADIITRLGDQYLDIRYLREVSYQRQIAYDCAKFEYFWSQAPAVHQAHRYKVICGIQGVRRPYRRSGCTGWW